MSTSERSLSRGRVSSGRGGAGNIRSPSVDPVVISGPDDVSDTRGREPIPSGDPDKVISTGRGGRGNIRSPSRDPVRGDAASISGVSPARSDVRGRGYDRETIASFDMANENDVHSFGRGGAGNMTTGSPPGSKSRSRSREPAAHTVGRGGVGNTVLGGPSEKDIEEQDEAERSSCSHELGIHTVGRGGYGNATPEQLPYQDRVNPHGASHPHATHAHVTESRGRGGFGNITTVV